MKAIRSNVEVLTQQEIEEIHQASLRVLERVGFKVPNYECLNICKEFGAIVDFNSEIIKIPQNVMEDIVNYPHL